MLESLSLASLSSLVFWNTSFMGPFVSQEENDALWKRPSLLFFNFCGIKESFHIFTLKVYLHARFALRFCIAFLHCVFALRFCGLGRLFAPENAQKTGVFRGKESQETTKTHCTTGLRNRTCKFFFNSLICWNWIMEEKPKFWRKFIIFVSTLIKNKIMQIREVCVRVFQQSPVL